MIPLNEKEPNIYDNTINNQCSRCGECCGLFIPFTQKELATIKRYVKEHNIKPTFRLDLETNTFEAHCCFYDKENKKCNIYEARPFACRDFICSRKNWKQKRDLYEKRAKYNSTLSKKTLMGTFDDLVFDDYYPILRYLISLLPVNKNGIDSKHLLELFKKVGRLDLLEHINAEDETGKKVSGKELEGN